MLATEKKRVLYSDIAAFQHAHLGVRRSDLIEWRLTNDRLSLSELAQTACQQFYRATLLYPTAVRVGWPDFTDELIVIATKLAIAGDFPADLDVTSLPDGRAIPVHLDHSLGPHTAVAEYALAPDTSRLNVRTVNLEDMSDGSSPINAAVAS